MLSRQLKCKGDPSMILYYLGISIFRFLGNLTLRVTIMEVFNLVFRYRSSNFPVYILCSENSKEGIKSLLDIFNVDINLKIIDSIEQVYNA